MAEEDRTPLYTLHYFPFSLYSLMVTFGLVLGESLNPETAPQVELHHVNLQTEENLSEPYLTTISSKGQVPVLTSAALPSSIDDSYAISKWLCEKQPELLPEQHRDDIDRLLGKLYDIHAMALSIAPYERNDGIPNQAAALLENAELSLGHRRALEIKSVFHDSQYSRTLEPENITHVEDQARDFMRDLAEVLKQHDQEGTTWIFGHRPTILDAHAAVLTARMMDLGRFDLVSDTARVYATAIKETKEWAKATHGRPMVWNALLGSVADLDPL